MNQLLLFLTDLAIDPNKQRAFEKEPEALMAAAGLSESEQVAIKSKDSLQISAFLKDEYFQAALVVGVPNPDPLPDPDPPLPPDPPEDTDSSNNNTII
ncbi:MAG: hypothetical protein F6K58_19025 [Symploca sp. SIO2E9]|nr:hypothetical protein [Symploca sp. SIO2E9]